MQLAANLILAGATATRPGALIGQLLYEHLEFQLFPPLLGDERPRVVLKVNLKHIKRSAGDSDPKEFAFREDDMLIYDPLIPIMGLAFADGAFINEFKDPQEIYELVVPPNSDRLRLRWKEEWCSRPVFRDVEDSEEGIRIALDQALKYQKERGHLIRLGRSIGMAKVLEWYDLRRGSGKKLNGKPIQEITIETVLTRVLTQKLSPLRKGIRSWAIGKGIRGYMCNTICRLLMTWTARQSASAVLRSTT